MHLNMNVCTYVPGVSVSGVPGSCELTDVSAGNQLLSYLFIFTNAVEPEDSSPASIIRGSGME